MANTNVFIAQVKQDLINRFKKDAVELSNKIDFLQQQAIDDVEAVDTGFLQQKTFTQFFVNLSSNIIGKVKFTTRGANYGIFVHEGLGTNVSYGRRPYLEIARNQTLELITEDKVTRVYKKGSPFKRGRTVNKRKFN